MPKERIEIVLAHIMAAGWSWIDLEYWTKFGLRFDFLDSSPCVRQDFRRRLESYGLRVLGINVHHSMWGTPKWTEAQHFYMCAARWGNELGARHCTIQLCEGATVSTLPRGYYISLATMAQRFADYGMRLLVELPHSNYGVSTLEDLMTVGKSLPVEVGVTVDTRHLQQSGISYEQFVSCCGLEKIHHVHLKNPHRVDDDVPQWLRTFPGLNSQCVEIEEPQRNRQSRFKAMQQSYFTLHRPYATCLGKSTEMYASCAVTYDRCRYAYHEDMVWLREALSTLALKPCHVLDIGCGSGVLCEALPASSQVVGVDICRRLLSIAEARYGARFIGLQMDMTQLPPRSAQFDGVVLANSLHHLQPDAQISLVQTVLRYVRSGGFFYLVHPVMNPSEPRMSLCGQDLPCHVLPMSIFRDLLSEAGYVVQLAGEVEAALSKDAGYRRPHAALFATQMCKGCSA